MHGLFKVALINDNLYVNSLCR